MSSDPKSRWSKSQEVFQVYECIPPWVQWQQGERESSKLTKETRAGINYSMILGAACYIEGFFERLLLTVACSTDSGTSPLFQRLLEDLRMHISATTGSERYDLMCELVLGCRANQLIRDPQLWESVRFLFHFRNMLAHGRAVSYALSFPPSVGGYWDEEFKGGYSKVEDYLLKQELITDRHIEVADNWHYLQDAVADHFWDVAQRFVAALQANSVQK